MSSVWTTAERPTRRHSRSASVDFPDAPRPSTATILGRPYVINNLMAENEVALGDFGQTQWVRQVGGLYIKTSQEVFFRKNMEGVAGFASYDAKIVNPYASILLVPNA